MDNEAAKRPTASSFLVGATCFLTVHFVLTAYYFGCLLGGPAPVSRVFWLVLAKPTIVLGAAILLTWMHYRSRVSGPGWLGPVTMVVMVLLTGVFSFTPWGWDLSRFITVSLAALCARVITVVSKRLLHREKLKSVTLGTVTILVILTLGAAMPRLLSNQLGLVSNNPGSTNVVDYRRNTNKDNYPTCTFEYNSLGYRDIEPVDGVDEKTRILLVGDSYVWGDGIPTNEQTLAYRLRDALEQRRPGAYDVVAAAYPGIDLYGYVRFTKALQPYLSADIVVISYLDDCSLADAQYLFDRAPDNGIVRRWLALFTVFRHAHESIRVQEDRGVDPRNLTTFRQNLLTDLARHSTANGYRVFFLSWSDELPTELAGFRVITLPENLTYQGETSEFWHAKDYHPKPLLIERVSEIIANAVTGG